jgi:hypothetical protein
MPPIPSAPGPVLRHLTALLSSGKSVFTPPRLTHLIPKPPKSSASGAITSPGQFANLFVTDQHKPDMSDGRLGKGCLVSEGGANFR